VRPGRGTTLCVDWEIHGGKHSPRPHRSERPHMAVPLRPPSSITAPPLRSGSSLFHRVEGGDQLV
jgi:hypothetical protein